MSQTTEIIASVYYTCVIVYIYLYTYIWNRLYRQRLFFIYFCLLLLLLVAYNKTCYCVSASDRRNDP